MCRVADRAMPPNLPFSADGLCIRILVVNHNPILAHLRIPAVAWSGAVEVASTRAGGSILFINETPPNPEGPEAGSPRYWWKRGRFDHCRISPTETD